MITHSPTRRHSKVSCQHLYVESPRLQQLQMQIDTDVLFWDKSSQAELHSVMWFFQNDETTFGKVLSKTIWKCFYLHDFTFPENLVYIKTLQNTFMFIH